MRVGSLPVEVANLQSVPCDAVSAAEMERNFHKRYTIRRTVNTIQYAYIVLYR